MPRSVSSAARSGGCVVAALALAGCFTTTADFREEAETFIVEDPEVASLLGTTFVSATCVAPERQDVDEKFSCSATDELDRSWDFQATITGEGSFRVEVVEATRPDS